MCLATGAAPFAATVAARRPLIDCVVGWLEGMTHSCHAVLQLLVLQMMLLHAAMLSHQMLMAARHPRHAAGAAHGALHCGLQVLVHVQLHG